MSRKRSNIKFQNYAAHAAARQRHVNELADKKRAEEVADTAAAPQRQRDKHSEVTSTSQDVANAGTTTGEATSKPNPYRRLLDRIDEDNHRAGSK